MNGPGEEPLSDARQREFPIRRLRVCGRYITEAPDQPGTRKTGTCRLLVSRGGHAAPLRLVARLVWRLREPSRKRSVLVREHDRDARVELPNSAERVRIERDDHARVVKLLVLLEHLCGIPALRQQRRRAGRGCEQRVRGACSAGKEPPE